jgi:hypothetical protein
MTSNSVTGLRAPSFHCLVVTCCSVLSSFSYPVPFSPCSLSIHTHPPTCVTEPRAYFIPDNGRLGGAHRGIRRRARHHVAAQVFLRYVLLVCHLVGYCKCVFHCGPYALSFSLSRGCDGIRTPTVVSLTLSHS